LNVPYLFHVVLRTHNWRGRFDKWAFARLMRNADKVVALTPGGAQETQEAYGVPVGTLPPPVDMSVFRPHDEKDLSRPRVLFTGDLGDPRKGGALLLRAWDEIHRRCPGAVLVLAGPFGVMGYDLGFEVYTLERLSLVRSPAARDAIEILGAGSLESLPREYSRAAVTVLPSYDEAFGMVVTESLACGTPVICSSHAGPGEIITSPEVGVTVPITSYLDVISEGKAQALADAVLQGIELARQPYTSARCREWAEPWGLERVGLLTEAALAEVAGYPSVSPVPLEREGQLAWLR
jgi:glycosyltransferase involved in cell wall biosynthesis